LIDLSPHNSHFYHRAHGVGHHHLDHFEGVLFAALQLLHYQKQNIISEKGS